MGGYGTLSLICHHPEIFAVAVALSPANFTLEMLDWKLVVPMVVTLLGRAAAETAGGQLFDDILETQDIIFTRERPLIPSLVRGSDGKVVSYDHKAAQVWSEFDINNLAEKYTSNLSRVTLLINCEVTDEFGLAGATRRLHDTFARLDIGHEFEIYSDSAAAELSPHIMGIAYKLIPALKFCLQHIS